MFVVRNAFINYVKAKAARTLIFFVRVAVIQIAQYKVAFCSNR